MTTAIYQGRDKERHAVYRHPTSGYFFTAPDQKKADALIVGAPLIGMPACTYIARFGPVRKSA